MKPREMYKKYYWCRRCGRYIRHEEAMYSSPPRSPRCPTCGKKLRTTARKKKARKEIAGGIHA